MARSQPRPSQLVSELGKTSEQNCFVKRCQKILMAIVANILEQNKPLPGSRCGNVFKVVDTFYVQYCFFEKKID